MHTTQQERILIVAIIAAILIGSGITLHRRSRGLSLESPSIGETLPAEKQTDSQNRVSTVVVHVTGAVASSGVYELPADSRVMDAIDAAGGLAADSDPERINLAAVINDGQQIHVPSQIEGGSGNNTEDDPSLKENEGTDHEGKIRINTASITELQQLPGIGPVLAERIVAYRIAHGVFTQVDDLLNVTGIGAKKLADMKDRITLY